MRRLICLFAVLSCGMTAVALLAILAGCETQSANSPITIAPGTVTVHKGDAITFTADGGFEYLWELSDHVYGILSNARGRQTTYTVINEPTDNDVVVVLTATSTITGAGQPEGGTAYEATGEATIRIASVSGGAAADVLRISPTSVTLGPNETQVFTASGGSGTYTWAALTGSVSPTTGNQTTYTAPDYATNSIPSIPDGVTVTDSDSNVVYAQIDFE